MSDGSQSADRNANLPPEPAENDPREPASRERLFEAFGQTNLSSSALSDNFAFDPGHRVMRAQYDQHKYDPYENNILPYMALSTVQTPETYFLGGPGSNDREISGQFVDRLGNTFDVLESLPPPAQKDYTSTAPDSSNRNLERLNGGPGAIEKTKKEVEGIMNPADPSADVFLTRERREIKALKGRQTFFNQTELQAQPEFDTRRDQYSGYNVATKYNDLIHSVEPCWRETHTSQAAKRPDAALYSASPRLRVRPTSRDETPQFARKPNTGSNVRAGAARIALPYLPAATLRSDATPMGLERVAACYANGPNATARTMDVNDKPELKTAENKRVGALHTARTADPHVAVSGTDALPNTHTAVAGQFPVAFSSTLPDVHERGDTYRNNDNLVQPAPSRDWSNVQRVLEEFERDGGDDDMEISELTRRMTVDMNQPAPREAVSLSQENLTVNDPKMREAGGVVAKPAQSTVHIRRPDVPRAASRANKDSLPVASATRSTVHVDRRDVPENNAAHEFASVIGSGAREVAGEVRVIQRMDASERAEAKQQESAVGARSCIHDAIVSEERTSVQQPVSRYNAVGQKVIATPIINDERAHREANLQSSGSVNHVGQRWKGATNDKPAEARALYAPQVPTRPANIHNTTTNMRATPTESNSRGGMQSTFRHDSVSNSSVPMSMSRSHYTANNNHDRSTPTRAMTPNFAPSNARWTPTQQLRESAAPDARWTPTYNQSNQRLMPDGQRVC